VALDAFGPRRLMYGSDWPMACLTAGPAGWRAAVDELIAGLAADERRAVLGTTAAVCYRLGA
jgi:L-fuconolactonase